MKNAADYVDEACSALTLADEQWTIELRKTFGWGAVQARYEPRGRGLAGSELRRTYEHRQVCLGYWEAAREAYNESMLDNFNWVGSRHHY